MTAGTETQDAYVLGVNAPLSAASAK